MEPGSASPKKVHFIFESSNIGEEAVGPVDVDPAPDPVPEDEEAETISLRSVLRHSPPLFTPMKIKIGRIYGAFPKIQYSAVVPPELERKIDALTFMRTVIRINAIIYEEPYGGFIRYVLAVLDALGLLCSNGWSPITQEKTDQLNAVIEAENESYYHSQGVHLLMTNGIRKIEVMVYGSDQVLAIPSIQPREQVSDGYLLPM